MCRDELKVLAIGARDGVRALRALVLGNGDLVRPIKRVVTEQRERKRFAPPWIRAAET